MKKQRRAVFVILLLVTLFCIPAGAASTSVRKGEVGKTWTISGYPTVKSSRTSVAKVKKTASKTYTVKARKAGQATLGLYNKAGKCVQKIYLLVTNDDSFQYDTSSVTLTLGAQETVKAKAPGGCTVSYKSSDKSVATVNSSGKIKAAGTGTATISAQFYYRGTKVKTLKKKVTVTKTSTLKELLLTALEPVGSTMYVWGGGWNKADTGAGKEARTIGVSARWKKFFNQQTSSYDYNSTRYQIHDGLDCSGYIGWCIYNILNTTDGNEGYVMYASEMASNFASRGWGTYKSRSQVKNYRAGDIMSSSGHVWMAVGSCSDGSVVLLHSSPPGVQLCGTPSSSGKAASQAVSLATTYMKRYFPKWYNKFPDCSRGSSYLTDFSQMRWDVSGKSVMTDPDNYRSMSASQILADLFASR